MKAIEYQQPNGTETYQENARAAFNLYGKQWPHQGDLVKGDYYSVRNFMTRLEYRWAVWDGLALEDDGLHDLPDLCVYVRGMVNGSVEYYGPDLLPRYNRYLQAVLESWEPGNEFDDCIKRMVEIVLEMQGIETKVNP